MAKRNYDYSCGGTSTEYKKIKFVVDDQTGVISEVATYEGPCDLKTGEFYVESLKKTPVKSEASIRDHIEGIKLKLKTELNITNPTFNF